MATKSHTNTRIVLLLACVAQFMVVLDVAIVNVALPSIQRDLGIGQSSVQWIIIAYGLMLGGFLLLGGRIADIWGRRRTLISGLTVFVAASIVAGSAGSPGLLIAARAVQGLGAALIPPATLAILATTFDEGAARSRALGLYGATAGVSASVGVIASGMLTSGPGWRWIFFINAPVGALLIALAVSFLPNDSANDRARERFDIAGAATVTGGLLLLVYALGRSTHDGWTSASTLGLLAAAAGMITVFVGIEARSRSPLVPAAAVRNRTLVAANLSAFLLFGAFFAFIFLGSLQMQQVLGYSATKTGLAWLATTVTSFFAAAAAGAKLVGTLGVRRLLAAGFALLGVAAWLLTRVPADAHYATDLLPVFVLAGLAGGLGAPAIQIGALTGVPRSMAGLAGGLVETMREVGGGVAVAVVATVLVSRLRSTSAAGPLVNQTAAAHAFHAAYWVIFAGAILGMVTASIAFPRQRLDGDVEPTPALALHES